MGLSKLYDEILTGYREPQTGPPSSGPGGGWIPGTANWSSVIWARRGMDTGNCKLVLRHLGPAGDGYWELQTSPPSSGPGGGWILGTANWSSVIWARRGMDIGNCKLVLRHLGPAGDGYWELQTGPPSSGPGGGWILGTANWSSVIWARWGMDTGNCKLVLHHLGPADTAQCTVITADSKVDTSQCTVITADSKADTVLCIVITADSKRARPTAL